MPRIRPLRWRRPGPRFWPDDGRVTLRGVVRETGAWLRRLRPVVLAAIALTLWPVMDPALVDPPGFLASEPETVDRDFTRCGRGRGFACVIDGDTFRLGDRKVRIIGIDAPEINARCPKEQQLAEQATAALQANLNRGPFEMVGSSLRSRDQYGRELRTLRRKRPDGGYDWVADEMRATGLARRYLGYKAEWC